MDGDGLPGAARRNHGPQRKGRWGLKIVWRGGWAYVMGTVRAGGRSIRVRRSTGVSSREPGAAERAEAERFRVESEIRTEAETGRKPLGSFAEAARDYLKADRERPLGSTTIEIVDELLAEFSTLPLDELARDPGRIDRFFARRFAARTIRRTAADGTAETIVRPYKPATRRRHQVILDAILAGKLKELPAYRRTESTAAKGTGIAKQLPAALVTMLVEEAAPHLKPALAVMFATGARVSMTMATHKTDYVLAPGRERVIFQRYTKNGNVYDRRLHPWAAEMVRAYFKKRRDPWPDAFLTNRSKPYSRFKGGMIKTGFHGARDRLQVRLARMTDEDWIRVAGDGCGRAADWIPMLERVTPHWARHNFANAMRRLGFDVEAIRRAGMWESDAVVRQVYMVEGGELTGEAAISLPFGDAKPAQPVDEAKEKDGTSKP